MTGTDDHRWRGRLGPTAAALRARLRTADGDGAGAVDGGPVTAAGAARARAGPPSRIPPSEAIPWGLRVAAEAAWRLLVIAGGLWVLFRVVSALRIVVLAFAVALLVTALLQPTGARLHRHGLPRGPATALTALCGFVLLGLAGWFVVWQVMDNADVLTARVREGVEELKQWLLRSPLHVTEKQINSVADSLSDGLASGGGIASRGLQGVTVLVEVLTGILLAIFSTLFLLYDGPRIWRWSLIAVPAAARPAVADCGPAAWATLTGYVRGTVIVALVDAVFIGLGVYFLGVPLAVPLGVFIFLFSFIPLVGAVVSGALAVVVALVTEGLFAAAMVLMVVLLVQQIEGHVLQPFILGRAVRVHPLGVVLAVSAGGTVAGIGGAVVAVPLVAVLKTVVGQLRRTAAAADPAAADPAAPAAPGYAPPPPEASEPGPAPPGPPEPGPPRPGSPGHGAPEPDGPAPRRPAPGRRPGPDPPPAESPP
ncbi:AI-2E family transporter [Streptomyces sp. NPDC101132]|uniref:AI-2E family transporter n=1 Tax=Streptomyces sp. NPDC101132 TaxID=3366110 RepID=UPI00382C2DD3